MDETIKEIYQDKKLIAWVYLDNDLALAIKLNPVLTSKEKKQYEKEMCEMMDRLDQTGYFL